LRAVAHSACRIEDVAAAGDSPYFISFEYRTIAGQPARICIATDAKGPCLVAPSLPRSSEWQQQHTVIAAGVYRLVLTLYADGSGGTSTVTQYRRVDVVRLVELRTVHLNLPPPPSIVIAPGAANHVASVSQAQGGPRFAGFEQVGDCGATGAYSVASAGISATAIESPEGGLGVELGAAHDVACLAAPIIGFVPGISYQLSFAYRTVAGRGPRICIEELLVRTSCAPSDPLSLARSWHTMTATFTPSSSVRQVRLVLFADAGTASLSRVDYRNIQLRLPDPVALVSRSLPGPSSTPRLTATRVSETEYRVRVDDAHVPYVLVMADSFAPGWRLHGPAAAASHHFVADGYANGWEIDRPGSYELTVRLETERLAHTAVAASEGFFVLAIVAAGWAVATRRLERDRRVPQASLVAPATRDS
jgi:hypothetical protein